MNKKAVWTLGILFLAAALLALPGPAKAEMYVEAYLGGAFSGDLGTDFTQTHPAWPGANPGNAGENLKTRGSMAPAVMGGVKIGTWFVPTGFLGASYPDWMKYFGFNLDFSYHRLNATQHSFDSIVSFYRNGVAAPRQASTDGTFFKTEGTAFTLAFMFAARYGFFQDSEVPFGRLQPYVAVGPAILFSTQTLTYRANRRDPFGPKSYWYSQDTASRSSVNVALAVEGGIRYMCLKNVSVDLSFKYRYAQPSYKFTPFDDWSWAGTTEVKYNPTYNLFSGQLGVAYHF